MNLLIADDHPGMRSRLAEIIIEAFPEVHVTHACNGTEVLSLCSSFNYDALIMDTRMPGYSGIEVLRKLRKGTSIPVILISTHSNESYLIAAVKAGANAFISKDALADKLAQSLRNLLIKEKVI